jgi:hypothetical protein
MSLLDHVEENASHMLRIIKHMMQVEQNMYGTTLDVTQKLHDLFDAHVNSTAVESVEVVEPVQHTEEPDHVEPEVVVKFNKA